MEGSVNILEVELTSLVNRLQRGGEGERGKYQGDSHVCSLSFHAD